MNYKYTVISADLREDNNQRVGFLGTVESQNKLHTHQTVEINGELYNIVDADRKDLTAIYVMKVQSLKMYSGEYESDVTRQLLSTIIKFIERFNIKTHYYSGGVRLGYNHENPANHHRDFQVVGENLTDAMVNLRNEMIRQGVIKRGEW